LAAAAVLQADNTIQSALSLSCATSELWALCLSVLHGKRVPTTKWRRCGHSNQVLRGRSSVDIQIASSIQISNFRNVATLIEVRTSFT
jgi:hypothetical protein